MLYLKRLLKSAQIHQNLDFFAWMSPLKCKMLLPNNDGVFFCRMRETGICKKWKQRNILAAYMKITHKKWDETIHCRQKYLKSKILEREKASLNEIYSVLVEYDILSLVFLPLYDLSLSLSPPFNCSPPSFLSIPITSMYFCTRTAPLTFIFSHLT